MIKRTILFRILTLVYLVAVGFLCFGNFGGLPEVQRIILGIPTDKLVHFLMFVPFAFLAFWSFSKADKAGIGKTMLALLALFALGCLIAWGTEVVQGKLPYRTFDVKDFRADRIGLACGTIITFVVQSIIRRKKADA